MAPEKPQSQATQQPEETIERAKTIHKLRTQRLNLSGEISTPETNTYESFDEYFGNNLNAMPIQERKLKHKKTIDSKHIAMMMTAQLKAKYGENFIPGDNLQDADFAQSLQDYIDLPGQSKDGASLQKLTTSTAYLIERMGKVSDDTEYNQMILEALRQSSNEWKYNSFMLEDEEYGLVALAKKDAAAIRKAQGLINDEQYAKEIEEINKDYIEKSNNEELKAIWDYSHAENKNTELGPNKEIPVRDDKTLKTAIQETQNTFAQNSGWEIKFDKNSAIAEIQVGENIRIDASIYSRPETGEFVFYLSDKFGHGDKKGPYKASEIADQIDARQVDGHITERIEKLTTDPKYVEGIKQVPDDMVANLGLTLIRKNIERQYAIKNNDRIILDNLSACLIAPDQEGDKKYPTMYDKVKALNTYLMQESNIKPLVEKLLATKNQFTVAEAPTISGLLQG